MSDYDDKTPTPEFEEPEVEVVDSLDDGEDDEVRLSREEFEALKSQKGGQEEGSEDAAAKMMRDLATAINQGRAPEGAEDVAAQQPGESWEDFQKRANEEIFGDNPTKAVLEIINRSTGGYVQQMNGIVMQQAKQLMRLDPEKGELYRKYEDEIEKKVKQYGKNGMSPQVLERAYKDVVAEHQSEIIGDSVKEQARAEAMRILKEEYGIDPEKAEGGELPKGNPPHYEKSGQRSGSSQRRTKKIVLTDRQKAEARMVGFPATPEGYAKYARSKGLV